MRALSCCNSGNAALISTDEVVSCAKRMCAQAAAWGQGLSVGTRTRKHARAGILAQSFCVRQVLQFTGKELARTTYTNVRNILSKYALLFLPTLNSGLVASYAFSVLAQHSAGVSTAPKLSLVVTVESWPFHGHRQ